jgi:PHP domain
MSGHDPRHCHHDDDRPQDEVPYGQVQFDATTGRRAVLFGASGALMLAAMRGSASASTKTASAGWAGAAAGAGRASRLIQSTMLAHADMHNHTVMSDGDGRAELAFASMREAGLDVAALTDHTTLFAVNGLSSSEWNTQATLANAANDPGLFTAIRGFEWSHPTHGHINVWNTSDFADLLRAGSPGSLYSWLTGRPAGLASFNHPGREAGRFNNFAFNAAARNQFAGLEMFNRTDDYLFEGWSQGMTSPLVPA